MNQKVFISIPWFAPAYRAGGPIQSIRNLVAVPQHRYRYFIFCGDKDLNGEALEIEQRDEWIEFNKQTEVFYATSDHFKKMKSAINTIRPDVLMLVGLFSWEFNIRPLLFLKSSRKILSVRGMLHPGALSQKVVKKRLFLSLLRSLGIQQRVIFHVTDPQESRYVKEHFGSKAKAIVAGNYPSWMKSSTHPVKEKGKLRLLTIALISPMKNHLLVLQSLAQCKHEIQYDLVGPVKDADYWNACLAEIRALPENIKVIYHGEQPPDNLHSFYSNTDCFIMPSKSENFAHALIEAMSGGIPVITSHFTPWNQLEENYAGINVDLNKESLIAAIGRLVEMDESVLVEWRSSAENYAKSAIHYDELENQYVQLLG